MLSVTPDSVEMKVMRNGDAEFVIKVENKGESTLIGTLESDCDWITFRGTGRKEIDFSAAKVFETAAVIDGSKLPDGAGADAEDAPFTGRITVASNGGRAEIPVKVAIAKDPKLETDRRKIIIKDADIVTDADSVIRSEFTVTNGGDGILTGTVTPNRDWIRAVPETISTADSVTVAVEIDTAKAPNIPLLFGKINVETNGGSAEITVGVTIQK